MDERHVSKSKRLKANRCSSKFISQREVILEALESGEALSDSPGGAGLYEHQAKAVLKLEKELGNEDNGISLAVLPTGTGKSGVAVLAAYCCGDNKKVLVVTPSETISKQLYRDFFSDERDRFTFLEGRGLFIRGERDDYMPNTELIMKTDRILKAFGSRELIIANAQKFRTRSNVDLAEIPADRVSLVIVDEAHHYPAKTWKKIVEHFRQCRIIFLTATPFHGGKPILDKLPCYELSRQVAIDQGIIRDTCFCEVPNDETTKVSQLLDKLNKRDSLTELEGLDTDRKSQILHVLVKMKSVLDQHDAEDNGPKHQGMILAKDIADAKVIASLWNIVGEEGQCKTFVSNDQQEVRQEFEAGMLRVVVVIFRLIEGFDRKNISVVGILRNVQPQSRVYFAQFVGRAVRKLHPQDPVKATIISHVDHGQSQNYEQFEKLAEEDPEDPENIEDPKDTEDPENIKDPKDTEDPENIEDPKDTD